MRDLEFVQKCIKGDKQSWEQFVDKYSRLIYNYIHSILNAKGYAFTQQNIHDIFQEIFCSLINDNFKKLRTYKARNGCSLASWLRQVTINFTIDYLRRYKHVISLEEGAENGLSLKDMLADGSLPVTHALNAKELLAHLKGCIEELNIDDKFFLELFINKGLTPEELKDYFKVSRGAIDMRKSRIVDRLRQCFKAKGALLDS